MATVLLLALSSARADPATPAQDGRASAASTPWFASPDPEHPFARHEQALEVATVHALGLMTTMRIGAAYLWPEPFAETDPFVLAQRYGEALRMPPRWDRDAAPFEWDGDAWPINVVGHGLFGSELYLRARSCKTGLFESIVFAAGHSVVWEYAFEGNAVRPSALDLWYTPLAGAVLGELRFAAWYAGAKLPQPWRGITGALLDPFGELERALGCGC
jgi:hypothetical protein